MNVYMTHPEHGATYVQTAQERELAKARGWKESREPTADEIRAIKMQAQDAQAPAPARQTLHAKQRAAG